MLLWTLGSDVFSEPQGGASAHCCRHQKKKRQATEHLADKVCLSHTGSSRSCAPCSVSTHSCWDNHQCGYREGGPTTNHLVHLTLSGLAGTEIEQSQKVVQPKKLFALEWPKRNLNNALPHVSQKRADLLTEYIHLGDKWPRNSKRNKYSMLVLIYIKKNCEIRDRFIACAMQWSSSWFYWDTGALHTLRTKCVFYEKSLVVFQCRWMWGCEQCLYKSGLQWASPVRLAPPVSMSLLSPHRLTF